MLAEVVHRSRVGGSLGGRLLWCGGVPGSAGWLLLLMLVWPLWWLTSGWPRGGVGGGGRSPGVVPGGASDCVDHLLGGVPESSGCPSGVDGEAHRHQARVLVPRRHDTNKGKKLGRTVHPRWVLIPRVTTDTGKKWQESELILLQKSIKERNGNTKREKKRD